MQASNFSALARPLDVSYRSNLVVIFLCLLSFFIALPYQWLYLDTAFLDSLWWAAQASMTVFFSWALGREIDPDVNTSAFLAIPFSLIAFYFAENTDWLALLAFLMILRICSHVCGQKLKVSDIVLVLGLTAFLCWRGQYILGFSTAVVLLADYALSPVNRKSLWYALAALLLSIVGGLFFRKDLGYEALVFPEAWLLGVALNSLVFVAVINSYKRPHSTEDYKVQPLNGSRMQAAQLIVLLTLLFMFFVYGYGSALSLAAVWAAIVATNLSRLYYWLTKHSPY